MGDEQSEHAQAQDGIEGAVDGVERIDAVDFRGQERNEFHSFIKRADPLNAQAPPDPKEEKNCDSVAVAVPFGTSSAVPSISLDGSRMCRAPDRAGGIRGHSPILPLISRPNTA